MPLKRRSLDHDTTAPITKGDLWDVRDSLSTSMYDGFKGVHERQDKTNGRVNAAHEALAGHGAKIRNLEQEIFNRSRRAKPDGDNEGTASFTMRDVKMIGFGGSAVIGFVLFLWKILPAILKVLA